MAKSRTATQHNVHNSGDASETFIPCIVGNGFTLSLQKHYSKEQRHRLRLIINSK